MINNNMNYNNINNNMNPGPHLRNSPKISSGADNNNQLIYMSNIKNIISNN